MSTKQIVMKSEKKEKKVKVTPTEEQVNQMVLQYLKKSSYHTFHSRYVWDKEFDKSYYKVIPVTVGEKLYCVEMNIGSNKISFKLRDTSWVKNKNHLGMLKNEVFPQNIKHKAVNIVFAENSTYIGEMISNIRHEKVSTKEELSDSVEKAIKTFERTIDILAKSDEIKKQKSE